MEFQSKANGPCCGVNEMRNYPIGHFISVAKSAKLSLWPFALSRYFPFIELGHVPQDNGLEEPNKKHTTYTYNIMYDHLIGECRANRKIVIKALNGHFAHSFLSRTNAGCYW